MQFLKPQTHLLKGLARTEIPALAARLEVDLVGMGSVGRTGVPGFFIGNTAEKTLAAVDCSILTVKPKAFKTPVEVEIRGYNLSLLDRLARELVRRMNEIRGLTDVKSSTEGGNPELRIRFDQPLGIVSVPSMV